MKLFTIVKNLPKFLVIILNLSRKESKHVLVLKFLETENQCKNPEVFDVTDGTHVFVKASISESRQDYYRHKERYSINTQAVVGYILQFIDIATGFPGRIHDSRSLKYTALYQRVNNKEILVEPKLTVNRHQKGLMLPGDGANSLPKWLLKPYIFSSALSVQEKNFNKNKS